MSRINDDNYYQISGWMINRLGLKGTELQVFAIIYGFSQDGESWFSGSLAYLEDWTSSSKPTVIKARKNLSTKSSSSRTRTWLTVLPLTATRRTCLMCQILLVVKNLYGVVKKLYTIIINIIIQYLKILY